MMLCRCGRVAESWLRSRWAVLSVFGLVLALGCELPRDAHRAHLSGQITARSDVAGAEDNSGFRVLVLDAEGRSLDTLARARTNRDGRFDTSVPAPERGIYTLTVWGRRGNEQLGSTEYVVADGDSATVNLTLPPQRGRLRVRSQENAALSAYQNTLAQHRTSLVRALRSGGTDAKPTGRRIRRTSSILWRLRDTFPGTYASQLAATASLSLLAGRNDSLVVERLQSIEPSNPRYVEAAQIGRRAAARLRGQKAALNFLDEFETRATTDAQRAGVQAARVRLFIDSLESKAALSAAEDLRNRFPNTRWAEWADRAAYEVRNLVPGKEAPTFTARTVRGDSLTLRSLRGRPVVLEYFTPGNDLFRRQLGTRKALHEATRPDSASFVSVSVQPDTLLNRVLFEEGAVPGRKIIAAEGTEDPIAEAYNVTRVPTRFLIGADGRLVERYEGTAFLALQEDLAALVDGTPPKDGI